MAINLPGSSIEDKDKFESEEPNGEVKRWIFEIKNAEKEFKEWRQRSTRIVQRFKDERKGQDAYDDRRSTRYNILWSNINILQPSVYSRVPKPQVERRFKDRDPVGRTASQILERAVDYSIKAYDFDAVMRQVRDDFLLVARGQAWVRYQPYYETNVEVSRVPVSREVVPDPEAGLDPNTLELLTKEIFTDPAGNEVSEENVQIDEHTGALYIEPTEVDEQVVYEEVKCDYINWEDFLHSPARTWDEVTWVAKRVFMSRSELRDRFGSELGNKIPLDHSSKDDRYDTEDLGVENEAFKKAIIYEIWDKDSRKVFWVSCKMPDKMLDEEDDPLRLTNFFPCPKPLYGTMTNDSLIPIADFSMYQDQARELDDLTGRIHSLLKAIKVTGVYDASNGEIKRIMEEGADNELIPVKDWPTFQQRGGFQGVLQFLPFNEVAQVVTALYDARDRVIQDIFQITGISDIIRGSTSPSETATAQQIKGQFATLRLADKQREVQRYARDLMEIKAEIIAEHFSTDTIRIMSGTEFIQDVSIAQTFEQAVDLLRNDVLRQFRIDVETDSTLAIDEALEKDKRTEFLGTIGRFLSNTLETIQVYPEMAPLMAESLMFLMRGFKTSRALEAATEQSMQSLIQRIIEQQQQPEGPSPEEQEMQMKAQIEQVKVQLEQFKVQSKTQLEQQKAFADAEIKQLRAQIEAGSAQAQQLLEVQKAQADINLQREKLALETQLQAREVELKMALKQQEIVDKQNLETIKTLSATNGSETRENAIPPINIQVDASKAGRRVAKFQTAPDGSRVAEIVDVED